MQALPVVTAWVHRGECCSCALRILDVICYGLRGKKDLLHVFRVFKIERYCAVVKSKEIEASATFVVFVCVLPMCFAALQTGSEYRLEGGCALQCRVFLSLLLALFYFMASSLCWRLPQNLMHLYWTRGMKARLQRIRSWERYLSSSRLTLLAYCIFTSPLWRAFHLVAFFCCWVFLEIQEVTENEENVGSC